MDRERRKELLTSHIKKKAEEYQNSDRVNGTGVEAVVEWVLDFYSTDIRSESLTQIRELERENEKIMKKLWIDSYVAGSGNYSNIKDVKAGADLAVEAFDEMFIKNRDI